MNTKSTLSALLEHCARCHSGPELMPKIQQLYQRLSELQKKSSVHKDVVQQELEALRAEVAHSPRRRLLLDYASWPLFSHTIIQDEWSDEPHGLRIFALPFLVQMHPDFLGAPVDLTDIVENNEQLLQAIEDTGLFGEQDMVGSFPALFTKPQLQGMAPWILQNIYVAAETGSPVYLSLESLKFDPDLEAARTATLYYVVGVRSPIGHTDPLNVERHGPWQGAELAHLMKANFESQGIMLETVESLSPVSLSETLLWCSEAGTQELLRMLKLAKEEYALLDVALRQPMEGVAEICGTISTGEEVDVFGPFLFLEPVADLKAHLADACQQCGLSFKGAYAPGPVMSAMLH